MFFSPAEVMQEKSSKKLILNLEGLAPEKIEIADKGGRRLNCRFENEGCNFSRRIRNKNFGGKYL